MKINKDQIIQFIKFGIVGASNTIISYVVYLVLVKLGVYYLLASVLSFVVGVLNSFFWNNKYVFTADDDTDRNWLSALVKTFMSYAGTGLILSNILLYIWVDLVHIPEWLAPLINLVITVPLNYIVMKFWAFKDKKISDIEE